MNTPATGADSPRYNYRTMKYFLAAILTIFVLAALGIFYREKVSSLFSRPQILGTGGYIYKLADDICTVRSCMLAPSRADPDPRVIIPSIGIARLKGYYREVIKTSVPYGCSNEDKSVACKEYAMHCDQFVVVEGLESVYPKSLGFNNTENTLAIDLNGVYTHYAKDKFKLSQMEQESLLHSSVNKQVEIIIFKYKPVIAGEVGVCYSDSIILKVNENTTAHQ